MTSPAASSLLTWANGQYWCMEKCALETMTATLVGLAHGQPVAPRAALAQEPQRQMKRGASAVAVIPVTGFITYKPSVFSEFFGGTALVNVMAAVNAAATDPGVKGIFMPFDSPGGTVSGLIETAEVIRAARRRKPVIAAIDPLAASAAFWLATQAQEIVITPSGHTGSLGVFALHLSFAEALKKAGVKPTFIASTPEKVELSEVLQLSDNAKAAAQREVDLVFAAFLADVARGRSKDVIQVRRNFGQGRLVNAQDAVRAGMVDQIGTLNEVLSGTVPLLHRGQRGATAPAGKAVSPAASGSGVVDSSPLPRPALSKPSSNEPKAAVNPRWRRIAILRHG